MTRPFDIPVGHAAVVVDPFGNILVLVDLSKGRYVTERGKRNRSELLTGRFPFSAVLGLTPCPVSRRQSGPLEPALGLPGLATTHTGRYTAPRPSGKLHPQAVGGAGSRYGGSPEGQTVTRAVPPIWASSRSLDRPVRACITVRSGRTADRRRRIGRLGGCSSAEFAAGVPSCVGSPSSAGHTGAGQA